jgi:hypothetical protein
MIFESTEKYYSIWFPVAKDVYEGSLGVSCKVSPREEGQHHLIYLYTSNYQDQLDVMKAREILKANHGISAHTSPIFIRCWRSMPEIHRGLNHPCINHECLVKKL